MVSSTSDFCLFAFASRETGPRFVLARELNV